MKRFLKKFALIALIVVVAVLLLAVALTAIFEDTIGRKLLATLNEQIETELRVESFDLSVVTTFPNVAANLRGVELDDNRGGLLLETDNLSFRFGLLSLLSKSIKVKSVVVSNGALNVHIDRKSNANYEIFASSEQEDEAPPADDDGGGTAISLQAARLENIELAYQDESTRQNLSLLVREANFSGEFASNEFSLTSDADIASRFLEFDGERFLPDKDVGYDARVFVNLNEKKYAVEQVSLTIGGNVFHVDGSVHDRPDGSYFDLSLSKDDGDIGGVLALLPAQYLKQLGDFSSTGRMRFASSIRGLYNERENPEIKVELQLDDGRISAPQLNNPLKDVSLTATFDNGKFHNNAGSRFEISRLKGYFNRELLELRLRIDNFDDPRIDFQFDGVVPVASVYGLFENPHISDGDGEIEVKNFSLQGRYEDMIRTSRISRVKTAGEIEFDDAELTVNGEDIRIDRGRLFLQDNALTIEDIKFEGAGSDIEFKGSAFNLIPVLFADSTNSRRAELEFRAELNSRNLDLDRLLKISAASEAEEGGQTAAIDSLKEVRNQNRELFTSFLKGTFAAKIEKFNYNLIEGALFDGLLEFNNNEMTLKGSTRAMNGAFQLRGTVFFRNEPYLRANLDCGGIDVKEFFRQAENFGQEVLQDRHVSGTLNAKITIDAFWDQQGNFLDDKLRVLAGIGIEDGELVDFELMESFSTFVKVKDLKNIRFAGLQEYIEVRKRRLYIPVLFIQSNALNLTINGEHSFDNDIRYNIKVNAGQVLAERFRKYDPSLRPKEAKRTGWFNLYYTIAGTIDDYEIKAAKRLVKTDFERSEMRKREIELALRQEFGTLQLIEEPAEWLDENTGDEEEFLWDGEVITPEKDADEEFLDLESSSGNAEPAINNPFYKKDKAAGRDTTRREFW